MSVNNNLQGKTLYNGASYAPNRGTVSPAGYVKRGLQNYARTYQQPGAGSGINAMQVGRDGQSDTRSGLAQKALASRVKNQMYSKIPGASQSAPVNTQASPAQYAPGPGQMPNYSQQDPGNLYRNNNEYNPSQGTYADMVSAMENKVPMIVSPLGELQLPYNFKYAGEVGSATSETNQALQEMLLQRQHDNLGYLNDFKRLQDEGALQANDALNDAASRGVAFSSGYGRTVADNMRNFNNSINELNANETLGQNSFFSRKAMMEDSLYQRVAAAALAGGYELSKEAGKWKLKKKKK